MNASKTHNRSNGTPVEKKNNDGGRSSSRDDRSGELLRRGNDSSGPYCGEESGSRVTSPME